MKNSHINVKPQTKQDKAVYAVELHRVMKKGTSKTETITLSVFICNSLLNFLVILMAYFAAT